MNLTILRLNIRSKTSLLSPLITNRNVIKLSTSRFSFFSSPVFLSSRELFVSHCSFKNFLSQVLKSSKYEGAFVSFTYDSFKNIKGSEGGLIFSFDSLEYVEIVSCSFNNIVTSSYPSCFLISKSDIYIEKCTFSYCSAEGGEQKYGNSFLCIQCNCHIKYIYFYKCSPNQSPSGDSPGALRQSKLVNITYINASSCRGSSGTSSITYRESTCQESFLSFITIIDPYGQNALESSLSSQISYISYVNIIYTTTINNYIYWNPYTGNSYFSKCAFINIPSNFSRDTNVFFDNCYSNKITSFEGVYTCDDNKRIEFNESFYTITLFTCIQNQSFKFCKCLLHHQLFNINIFILSLYC